MERTPPHLKNTCRPHSAAGSAVRLLFSETVPSNASAVEPLISRLFHRLGTTTAIGRHREALEIALREALANAILHGNGCHPQKSVTVQCYLEGADELLLVVADEGCGFDPGCVADPTRPERILREGGRGIYLIRHFMDEVEFAHGGCEIRMRKRL